MVPIFMSMNRIHEKEIQGSPFYGWLALAGVMLVIFVVGGSFFNSFGVFLPVICNAFGWSRAVVAAALSLGVAAFGLPSPLFGILVSRFGPRFCIITGNLLAGFGLACLALVSEIWHLYLFYIIIGLGAGFGGYIPATTVVNNWFIQKRSLALGMFVACAGLGGFVFPPVVTGLIASVGWRVTWLVLSGASILIAVLIGGMLLIRNKPQDMGQLPDGVSAGSPGMADTKDNPSKKDVPIIPVPMKPANRIPTAWFLAALAAANAFAGGTLTTHQVAYLQDLGFNPMTAATTISLMAAFQSMGSLSFGTLALRYSIRHLACLAFIFQVASVIVLITAVDLTFIYIYAVLLGLSTGALITSLPTFVGAYYHRDRYARVLGVVFPFQIMSQAVAATAAGAIYDLTSTYTTAFSTVVFVSLIGLASAFLARPPRAVVQ